MKSGGHETMQHVRIVEAVIGLVAAFLLLGFPRLFSRVHDKETKQEKPANLQDAVTFLNEFLAFDG